MGKRLLGIDLDESRAGGLVKRLLSEEELETLTDGGRESSDEEDDPAEDAGGFEFGDDREAAADDTTASDADTGDGDTDREDARDDAGVEVDVETSDDGVEIDVEYGDADDEPASLAERFPSVAGADDEDEGDDDSDGIVARVRPHLPKIAGGLAALAVLAALGFVAVRYKDTIVGFVRGKLGRGDDEDVEVDVDVDDGDVDVEVEVDDGVDVDEDAPPSRRRAKTPGVSGATSSVMGEDDDGVDDEDDEEVTVGTTGDSDVGALVGLGALALLAAVVRKVTEEREYDPLVDGPE